MIATISVVELSYELWRLNVDLVKNVIWAATSHKQDEYRPDVLLVGSRRSGSTLLYQLILQNRGFGGANQPFSQYSAEKVRRRYLPAVNDWTYAGLSRKELIDLLSYAGRLIRREIVVDAPWRFWTPEFRLFTNRMVIKTTDAHYIYGRLQDHIPFKTVFYLRHPIPQAISCIKNNWGDKLDIFGQSEKFQHEWLTFKTRRVFQKICVSGTPLERYVLCWCCENLPIFHASTSKFLTIYYEQLVSNPKSTIKSLSSYTALENVEGMESSVKKASLSSRGHSSNDTIEDIASDNSERLLSRWKDAVTQSDISAVQFILDSFELETYKANCSLPTL